MPIPCLIRSGSRVGMKWDGTLSCRYVDMERRGGSVCLEPCCINNVIAVYLRFWPRGWDGDGDGGWRMG